MQDQATGDVQLALPTSINMEETTFSDLNFLHVWFRLKIFNLARLHSLVLTQVGLTLPHFSFIQQKHKSSQLTATYYPQYREKFAISSKIL